MQKRRISVERSSGHDLLISEKHRNLYKMHYESKACVAHPHPLHGMVDKLARSVGAASILDYGCGPGRGLSKFLDINVTDYDPAVPGYDEIHEKKFDVVVANHVVENAELQYVDNVLEHLSKLTRKVLFFSVSCRPSRKQFADGSPVPRITRRPEWWLAKLASLFASTEILDQTDPDLELIILAWK